MRQEKKRKVGKLSRRKRQREFLKGKTKKGGIKVELNTKKN